MAVERCFTINPGVLSSVLCGQKSFDGTVRDQDQNPESGRSTPDLWTIIELLIPGNNNSAYKTLSTPTVRPSSTQEPANAIETLHVNPLKKQEHNPEY